VKFTRLLICAVLFVTTFLQIVWSQDVQPPQQEKPRITAPFVSPIRLPVEGPLGFEEFPASFRVTNQYEEVRGVIFNDVQVIDYSNRTTPFAHSGTKGIEGCPGVEIGCDLPFMMTFLKPQRRVKVWFGFSSGVHQADTVTLKILNAQKVLISQDSAELAPGAGPVPLLNALEARSASIDIAYATVSLRTSGGSSIGLALDDIEFDSNSPLPDLTIENLETKIGPDRQLLITAVIRNIGIGASAKSNVEISQPALWSTSVSVEVPPLKPEETAPVRWVTSIASNIQPGTYSYRMVVHPSEAIDDSDGTNNAKEGSFLIPAEKPDLSVRILKSGVDWYQRAFVLAEIMNTANVDSAATVVEVAVREEIIGRASVLPLKPQGRVEANIGIDKKFLANRELFQVVVNPNQTFEETDVTNNSVTGTFVIQPWWPTIAVLAGLIVICVVGISMFTYKLARRKASPSITQPFQPDLTVPTFVARPKVHEGMQELISPARQTPNIALKLRSQMVESSQQISIGSRKGQL
jgi:hypothetical protein